MKQSVEKQYKGYDIAETQKLENAEKGIIYKVTVETKDKGFDLMISPAGEILKKNVVVESD